MLSALHRFQPLETVLLFDTFEAGQNGWLDLRPNFVKGGYKPHSEAVDLTQWGPSMISSATFPRMGTHGSLSGTYSLKLTTRGPANPIDERPAPGSMGLSIKRLSQHRDYKELQLEAWVAYTPEDDREGRGDLDVRSFGCYLDLQSGGNRWLPGVRYLNSADGRPVKKWQYFSVSPGVTDEQWNYGRKGWHVTGVDSQWYGRRYADGSSDGFQWIPEAQQNVVCNESDDKINWMYLRLRINHEERKYSEFQFMNRSYPMKELPGPHKAPAYEGIDHLINPIFFIETDSDRRVFLFVDSVVLSVR